MIKRKDICHSVCKIAISAGNFIRKESASFNTEKIELKAKNDMVSYVDRQAETLIVKALHALLPDAGFCVEENSCDKKNTALTWIVDPLDGTSNFCHGLGPYAVSIALVENNEPTIAVVYEINADECFYAWKDGGAYLNNKRIYVSERSETRNAIISTGFPCTNFDNSENFLKKLNKWRTQTRKIRISGSTATDMAYVAAGRFDFYFEYDLKPWDIAAGILLVREAGGDVHNMEGVSDCVFEPHILAHNKSIKYKNIHQ